MTRCIVFRQDTEKWLHLGLIPTSRITLSPWAQLLSAPRTCNSVWLLPPDPGTCRSLGPEHSSSYVLGGLRASAQMSFPRRNRLDVPTVQSRNPDNSHNSLSSAMIIFPSRLRAAHRHTHSAERGVRCPGGVRLSGDRSLTDTERQNARVRGTLTP